MEDLITNKDLAIEHKFHDKYVSNCSTCFAENLIIKQGDHDCHASPEDGCDCQKFYDR